MRSVRQYAILVVTTAGFGSPRHRKVEALQKAIARLLKT
jgi:hypothetical protein